MQRQQRTPNATSPTTAGIASQLDVISAWRPRTGYLPVEGRLDYRAFADVLVAELGDTVDTRARRAERAGARLAGRIANSGNPRASGAAGGDALDRTASLTHEVFDRMGFAPEFAGADGPSTSSSRVIRLRDCPSRDLARAHPEVGCGVHRWLLQGLAGSSAVAVEDADAHAARLSARLEPFVEPELCFVTLAADDQAGA